MVIHNGEECWTPQGIMSDLYIDSGDDLRRFVRQGMPCIVLENGRRLFPKERVHAWFRGDTTQAKKRMYKMKGTVLLSWDKIGPIVAASGLAPWRFCKTNGICCDYFTRIKNGENIRISSAKKIATALGVDVKELMEE